MPSRPSPWSSTTTPAASPSPPREDIALAHARAHGTDPVSAYGGVIAANRTVTLAMAQQVKPVFTEVILAPGYEDEALELLRTKKNLRILRLDGEHSRGVEMREIWGGMLIQDADRSTQGRRPRGGRSPRARRPTRPPWPISPSPGARCAR